MAATFSGKQNQGWDIWSLMHCWRWLVLHLKGERGPEPCNNLFYSTCMTNKLSFIPQNVWAISRRVECCSLPVSTQFVSLISAAPRRKGARRKVSTANACILLLKNPSFSPKKCSFEEKRTAQTYFSWSQALTGGSQVETLREANSWFNI